MFGKIGSIAIKDVITETAYHVIPETRNVWVQVLMKYAIPKANGAMLRIVQAVMSAKVETANCLLTINAPLMDKKDAL
jgi:hypothetical protein